MKKLLHFTLLALLSLSLVSLHACSASNSAELEPRPRASEVEIKVIDQREVVSHPLKHPVPAYSEEVSPAVDRAQELSLDNFYIHPAHQGQVNTLVVSQDGTKAFSGGQDGKVIRSTIVTVISRNNQAKGRAYSRTVTTEALLESSRPILALALSPDEKKLAIAQFSSLSIVNLETMQLEHQLSKIKGRMLSLAWDPRGELLAIGRANGDIFVWNISRGIDAGLDSNRALERYEAGRSPVLKIVFHPVGRAFFALERDGLFYLWRLVRTERELGLRDDVVDREGMPVGRTVEVIANPGAILNDFWLGKDSGEIFLASNSGSIMHLRIRGKRTLAQIPAGTDSVFSLRGFEVVDPRHRYENFPLLVTSGRGQRLKFWCQSVSRYSGLATGLTPAAEMPTLESIRGFVGESAVFESPLTMLSSGERSSVLWAAEKTGNLLHFDAESLLKSTIWLARAERCEG